MQNFRPHHRPSDSHSAAKPGSQVFNKHIKLDNKDGDSETVCEKARKNDSMCFLGGQPYS